MSYYTVEQDDFGRVCPYCKALETPDDDEFSENSSITCCDRCGKKYHVFEEIIMRYHSKPDCEINDERHVFQIQKDDNGKIFTVCSVCNKITAVVSAVSHADIGPS